MENENCLVHRYILTHDVPLGHANDNEDLSNSSVSVFATHVRAFNNKMTFHALILNALGSCRDFSEISRKPFCIMLVPCNPRTCVNKTCCTIITFLALILNPAGSSSKFSKISLVNPSENNRKKYYNHLTPFRFRQVCLYALSWFQSPPSTLATVSTPY